MKVQTLYLSSGVVGIVVFFSWRIWKQSKKVKNNEITIQQLEENNRNQQLAIRNLEQKTQEQNQKDQLIKQQSQELENKKRTITNQGITISNLENQIQVKTLEIQNLNNSIRNQNKRIQEQNEQIIALQVLLVEKEKTNQELVQSLSNSMIKFKKQKENMTDRITKLLEIEIVTAIKQRITDVLKDFFNNDNIEQVEEEGQ